MNQFTRYALIFILLSFGIKGGIGLRNNSEKPDLKSNPYSPAYLKITPSGDGLLILEASARRLDLLRFSDGMMTFGQDFKNLPTGLSLVEDQIVVTSDHGAGRVHILNLEDLEEVNSFSAGSGARSPIYIPSKSQLAVCHTWLNEIDELIKGEMRIIKHEEERDRRGPL